MTDETPECNNSETELEPQPIEGVSEERLNDSDKPVPEKCRKISLEDAGYKCSVSGRKDIQRGGNQFLHVHHVEDDPNDYPYHHPRNLTVLSRSCHNLYHSATELEDLSPDTITLVADSDLDRNWLEIMRVLDEHGPCTVSEIQESVSFSSFPGVRGALYRLMSLDQRSDGPDRQILVKNRDTNEYGLPEQIPPDQRMRGTIPKKEATLEQRVRGEVVRRLDEHIPKQSHKRELIGAVADQYVHYTYTVQHRARALGFPLERWLRGEVDGWSQKGAHSLLLSVLTIPDGWDVDLVTLLDSLYETFDTCPASALATEDALAGKSEPTQRSGVPADGD